MGSCFSIFRSLVRKISLFGFRTPLFLHSSNSLSKASFFAMDRQSPFIQSFLADLTLGPSSWFLAKSRKSGFSLIWYILSIYSIYIYIYTYAGCIIQVTTCKHNDINGIDIGWLFYRRRTPLYIYKYVYIYIAKQVFDWWRSLGSASSQKPTAASHICIWRCPWRLGSKSRMHSTVL